MWSTAKTASTTTQKQAGATNIPTSLIRTEHSAIRGRVQTGRCLSQTISAPTENGRTVTAMAELKPCPFCGGKASRGVGEIARGYYECQAHCEICGAEIRNRYCVGSWVQNPERVAKGFISRLWNRRAGEHHQNRID